MKNILLYTYRNKFKINKRIIVFITPTYVIRIYIRNFKINIYFLVVYIYIHYYEKLISSINKHIQLLTMINLLKKKKKNK